MVAPDTVKDLAGVGRFTIGLADQIEVVDSSELDEHIWNFTREHLIKI